VIIAGGGIAGVEALLALRDLARSETEIELIAPGSEFVHLPMAVAEPFGLGEAHRLSLPDLAEDLGARYRADALASVSAAAHTIRTRGGEELGYDSLLVAVGTRKVSDLPGALTYGGPDANEEFREILDGIEKGEVSKLVFAVPSGVRWPLPLYELALLTAARLSVEITIATHEPEPLGLFGRRASDSVRALLEAACIRLLTSAAPAAMEEGGLRLMSGRMLAADRVVTLPRLEVAAVPGIPQGPHGFIGTDPYMRVDLTPRVHAAGDATWFPIKQGGLAAQQAEVAAASIAAQLEGRPPSRSFTPVLRAALLTGGAPRYLRSEVGDRSGTSAAGGASLWWPPAKVAGRYLAPYLLQRSRRPDPDPVLQDLEPLEGEDLDETEARYREALDLTLAAADADASWRDYSGALRWLEVAEEINLALPPEYAEKRHRWAEASARERSAYL
jgi:sulfide:quinone oxidoreductase